MALTDLHLADLHERARELEVPRYRMLTRDQLVEAIEEAGGDEGRTAPDEERPAGDDDEERRGGRRSERRPPPEEEVETEEVTGVLDRMPQGYGFLRLSGLHSAEGDVYVSASQIRRCELRPGDEVSGPAREPRRGEHHRALVRVASVNGQEPEGERSEFEDLTPVQPHRRLLTAEADADPLVRAVDLLAPLALGERILVLAEPRSGRTTLLRALARAFMKRVAPRPRLGAPSHPGARLLILLADERPEEVTEWERALPEAEVIAAPADTEPRDQVRAAELAIGHAKRRAEAGEDVVVIIDSLSRLALGYRDTSRVKRIFGAGRALEGEESGSLTVIATVLEDDEKGAEVRSALETTENVLIRLDAGLAAQGIIPSLRVADTRASGEEQLRDGKEMIEARGLRAELEQMDPAEAARTLGKRVGA
ncbi:MAG: Rho termination factor N-terminal domain-containing protein [Solirubrobacterales bacterium]